MRGCQVSISIVGWSHLPFGRLDALGLEDLIVRAGREALAHAGLPADEVDGTWLGNLNGGFVPDIFASSLALQCDDALRGMPAGGVGNACAPGSAAINPTCDGREAGRDRVQLAIGAEKMTAVSGGDVTRILGKCALSGEAGSPPGGFPGNFARLAEEYFEMHGEHSATLARIAAKNHANGVSNPWAHMRRDLGFEFCNTVSDKNRLAVGSVRKAGSSLVADGAAALVLASDTLLAEFPGAVTLRSRAQVTDYLPMERRKVVSFEG